MIKSPTSNDPTLLREEAAQLLLGSIDDAATQQLMAIAYTEVTRRFAERDRLPSTDFDLLFFMESMQIFFSKHDVLLRILAGEDLAAEWDLWVVVR